MPCAYAVLAVISNCYPPVWGRLSTRYSPVRRSVSPRSIRKLHLDCFARLACVKHAASVHPEPGSNSHVKKLIPGPDYLAWLIYPKPSLLGFCSEFSQIQRSKPDLLFPEFSGFYILFNLQLSRFSFCCQTCLLQRLFIITGCLSFVNNFFNLFFCFFRNICRSLKREDYISKSQTVCQQLFSAFIQLFSVFIIS